MRFGVISPNEPIFWQPEASEFSIVCVFKDAAFFRYSFLTVWKYLEFVFFFLSPDLLLTMGLFDSAHGK